MKHTVNLFSLIFIIVISLSSCKYKTNSYMKLFVKKHIRKPFREMDYCYQISNDTLFKYASYRFANKNYLQYRVLTLSEKDTLFKIIKNIKINSLQRQYCSNRYNAKYYYSLSFLDNGKRKDITIFQDTLPSELKNIILFIEQIGNAGKFEILKSKIEGINDIFFGFWINTKSDTFRLKEYDTFLLWKEFIVNNYSLMGITDYDTISMSEITVLYPLNYHGNKIKKIFFGNAQLLLKYEDEKVYKIERFKVPFDVEGYEY